MSDLIYGVDVSQWQGAINWATLHSKAEYAFIRAAYGTYSDKFIAANWPAAKAAGIPRGAYLYYYPTVDAGQQARAVIEALGGDYGELPLVVDVEEVKNVVKPWTNTMVLDLRWCLDVLEKFSGRKPIIYTGTWYWEPYIGKTDWATGYDLWVAQYQKDWTLDAKPVLPKDWQGAGYTFWQYSSTGSASVYGAASTYIDLDVFNGSREKLATLIG